MAPKQRSEEPVEKRADAGSGGEEAESPEVAGPDAEDDGDDLGEAQAESYVESVTEGATDPGDTGLRRARREVLDR